MTEKAKKIKIKGKDGKVLEVFEKAFRVVYSSMGYVHYDENGKDEKDIADMTESELKRVSNDKLKAYLDECGIEYEEDAVKADLIELIVE